MLPEVIWTRGAEADLGALYQELEDYQSSNGDRLLLLIDSSLQLLRHFPEMAPIFDSPIRRLVLNSRKHGVFYSLENRGIIIHAVADLRSDPSVLRARFREIIQG